MEQSSVLSQQKISFRKISGKLWYAISALAIFWFISFPIFWIGISAFKLPKDVTKPTISFEPTLQNFRILFSDLFKFDYLLLNSMIVCIAVVIITVPLALMGSYALSRYKIPGKRLLLVFVLATQFIPPVVLVLPYFNIFRELGILDTYTALVIVNLTRTIPFSMWLLFGFIDSLPHEIEQAAMVDGATEFGILRYITLPLAMPGVVTAGIFSFILAWNEFLYAFLLTSESTRTAVVGLVNVVGERDVPWEQMSAAGILVMIPMIIMAFSIRRYFVEGMTMGAVK